MTTRRLKAAVALYVSSPGDEADRPAALLVRDPGHLTLKQIPDDRGGYTDQNTSTVEFKAL